MLKRIVAADPTLVVAARPVVSAALRHENAEVQQAALDLADAIPDLLESSTLERIAADLPATLRRQIGRSASEPSRYEDPRPRAEQLPTRWRTLAGIDEALAENWFPAPLPFSMAEVPVLSGVARIEPIRDLDELIDAVAHAIESVDGADEVERILDGVSRLCAERPSDFEARTAPLCKRLGRLFPSEETRALTNSWGVAGIPTVLAAWLRPGEGAAGGRVPRRGVFEWMEKRLRELARQVRKRRAQPLASAPTHAGGWIEEPRGKPIGSYDKQLAKLRTASRPPDLAGKAYAHGSQVAWAIEWAASRTPGTSTPSSNSAQAGCSCVEIWRPRRCTPCTRGCRCSRRRPPWSDRAVAVLGLGLVGLDAEPTGHGDRRAHRCRRGRSRRPAGAGPLAGAPVATWLDEGGACGAQPSARSRRSRPSTPCTWRARSNSSWPGSKTNFPEMSTRSWNCCGECLTQLGLPLDARAGPALDPYTDRARRRSSRAHCSHSRNPATGKRTPPARAQLALGRIERAERWAAWGS